MKITIKTLLSITFAFSCLLTFAQPVVNPFEYTYFVGHSEPEPGWNSLDFDDSNWTVADTNYQQTTYSFGYGDPDVLNIIDTTTSAYMRIPFTVEDTSLIQAMQIYMTFDDGFVAYINGVEITRVNLGNPREFIPHDQLADRSHEAGYYRLMNGTKEFNQSKYYINESLTDSCLREGENILAFQVHNDSVNGSDLSLFTFIEMLPTDIYNPYWINKAIVPMDSSELPLVVIETDEFGLEKHKKSYNARMQIIHNENSYNKLSDSANVYNGNISIATRGQSTLHWPKTCFKLETKDSAMNDTNVAILNLPKENDWVLFGPLVDRSLIRNSITSQLANDMGQYTPRSFFCEVIYNGLNYGVYQFMEKIKRDKNRVDVKKLKTDENEGLNLTGAYIMKFDKSDAYSGDNENDLIIVYPKKDSITPQQTEYITSFYADYETSLLDENLTNEENGYRNYIDVPSFIDYTIMNELTKNPDAYLYSTYFYKDRDDVNPRLQYGPLWDFDLAYGNSEFHNGHILEGWQFEEINNHKLYHTQLFKDTALVRLFVERWQELRETTLSTENIHFVIDSTVESLGSAVDRNFEIWPMENRTCYFFDETYDHTFAQTYEEEIPALKSWVAERADWIDQNIESIYYNYDPSTTVASTNIHSAYIAPTISSGDFRLHIQGSPNESIAVEVVSLLGQTVYNTHTTSSTTLNLNDLSAGSYQVVIKSDNSIINTQTIIIQ